MNSMALTFTAGKVKLKTKSFMNFKYTKSDFGGK
jgi:hypothetical protein